MKLCPICGRAVPDEAIKCAYCGAALPAPETGAEPAADGESHPTEEPAKRKLSRKTVTALACAAALLGAGLLLFFLTRGGTAPAMLKSVTTVQWTEREGRETDRVTVRTEYDEKGLPVALSNTSADRTFTAAFAYELDDRGNPVSLVVSADRADGPEELRLRFANQYDGAQLSTVEITADQPNAAEGLLQVFSQFPGYRNARIGIADSGAEIQLQDGRMVHQKQEDGYGSVFEITHEYRGDVLTWTIQTETANEEETFRSVIGYADESGLIASRTIRQRGVSKTFVIVYEESADASGRPCRVSAVDPEKSLNVTEQDIADLGRQVVYTDAGGAITEIVNETPDGTVTSTRYDSLKRVTFQQTRYRFGDEEAYVSETTYEYR